MNFSFTNDENQSPPPNCCWINNDYMEKMIWLTMKHQKAQIILLFLLKEMDKNNAVTCSRQAIQEALGVGASTVTRNIKVLKDNGFIAISKSGTSNVYVVNKDLATL